MVEVILTAASICFGGECYPALIGQSTPKGEYTLNLYRIRDPRFGGTVLEFLRVGDEAFSVHRTWPGREKMYSLPEEKRRNISQGCVNVDPQVYQKLVACCVGTPIVIK